MEPTVNSSHPKREMFFTRPALALFLLFRRRRWKRRTGKRGTLDTAVTLLSVNQRRRRKSTSIKSPPEGQSWDQNSSPGTASVRCR